MKLLKMNATLKSGATIEVALAKVYTANPQFLKALLSISFDHLKPDDCQDFCFNIQDYEESEGE